MTDRTNRGRLLWMTLALWMTSCSSPLSAPQSKPDQCAWIAVNHSGVTECHVDGPWPSVMDVIDPSRINTDSVVTL